jgi:ParB/RepB/Spo0J family partition protein
MTGTKRMGGTLIHVSPEEISRNPHNPRLIFDEESLQELKSSIEKVGILVPITIYKNKKKHPNTRYILLDGERRWRCATELGINIPANVIDEPADVTQNLLFMFNIHHYREEWELFPTALKLEKLIKQLATDNESALSNFTGVSRSTIRRCKALLWFPHNYRDILMEKDGKISTDFFIEIFPIAYRLCQEDEFSYPDKIKVFIDACMDKFLGAHVDDVKEFREIRKCMAYYEKSIDFGNFIKIIKDFIKKEETGLEIFAVPEIENDRNRKNIFKYISYLNKNLTQINPNLISDIYFMDQLKELKKNLDAIIDKIE